jgi:eukaryotic-like serine/threonine-protein kinase
MTDMSRPRASRLSQASNGGPGRFSSWLPPGSTKRKIILRAVLPVLILVLTGLLVDKVVMPAVTRQGAAFPLPNFVDRSVTEAGISLSELSLGYQVSSEEYSSLKPTGIILQQFPKAGTKVKPGRSIKFVVSLGQKMLPIPDLAGKSVRQAMLDLETVGLVFGEIAYAFNDSIPERVVVFSYPPAGTEVPLGSHVSLMVNRGRASQFTFMPKVTGLTLTEARTLIEGKQLKVGVVTTRTDENYLPETVLEQSEPEGTELDIGTEVDIVVSST